MKGRDVTKVSSCECLISGPAAVSRASLSSRYWSSAVLILSSVNIYKDVDVCNVQLLISVTSVTAEDTAAASIQADNEAAKCILLHLKTKL